VIGAGTVIGQSAYISPGVVVGHGANIGSKATLGIGVSVGHGVEIGALSVIDRPGRIDANVAAKTFIHATHSQPIVIIGQ
jgi:UDP-3-O-[3-hydroxymyristoyl] glucosamine N-acyltransferase